MSSYWMPLSFAGNDGTANSFIIRREYGTFVPRRFLFPTTSFSRIRLLKCTIGHRSCVHCILFDRTGRFIITGSDDERIKIWNSNDGRLLATLRGLPGHIRILAIDSQNKILAAGSLEQFLGVWNLQTTELILLADHPGIIKSLNFWIRSAFSKNVEYLVATSVERIFFWKYSTNSSGKIVFENYSTEYHDRVVGTATNTNSNTRHQCFSAAFSAGGRFLAVGFSDGFIRIYFICERRGPTSLIGVKAYRANVIFVKWSHRGLRFISGSQDGTVDIWSFQAGNWKSMELCQSENDERFKTNQVAWNCSDKYVIAALNNFTIKIWNSKTSQLHCVLLGHEDRITILEANPQFQDVLLSADEENSIHLWDIEAAVSIYNFVHNNEGRFCTGKWSPDGTMIAATSWSKRPRSFGESFAPNLRDAEILIFGLGIGLERYEKIPKELFFSTDFSPLTVDGNFNLLDQESQSVPHLMPPPILVNLEGYPYSVDVQNLVPGHETGSTCESTISRTYICSKKYPQLQFLMRTHSPAAQFEKGFYEREMLRVISRTVDRRLMLSSNSNCKRKMIKSASEFFDEVNSVFKGEMAEESTVEFSKITFTANENGDWQSDCFQLLEMISLRSEFKPFCASIDMQIIDDPIDFGTIRTRLLNRIYINLADFAKDIRSIFKNAMVYSTNKRSRVYLMALRLSAFCDFQMKLITEKWNNK